MTELNNLLENIQNIQVNIGRAITNKGQMVTNFADYPNAILNIGSDISNSILLFSNISELNNYTTANIGDLAVVYDINTNNFQAVWQYNNGWELALTNFNTTNNYVDSAMFYGLNGIEQGTLQINSNLTKDELKMKTELYSGLSSLQLDTSINNISLMFSSFKNIRNVPNINTSRVINMSYMFADCTNLINIPNFNTSNVEDMTEMFANCFNLVDIPKLNMNNVRFLSWCFYNCTNLSNESISYIVNSIPVASQLSNQCFSNTGLHPSMLNNEQILILNLKGYLDCYA